jgi:hypothetical protein
MAYEENGQHLGTFKAGGDLSAASNQFRFVKLGTTKGQIVLAALGTDPIIGILQNKPNLDEVAIIRDAHGGGIAKVRMAASQNIAIGDFIGSNTLGEGVEVSAAGSNAIGYAIEADAATVLGQVISVYLAPRILGTHS